MVNDQEEIVRDDGDIFNWHRLSVTSYIQWVQWF